MTAVGAGGVETALLATLASLDQQEAERLDAADEFPDAAVEALGDAGLARCYVPVSAGGELVAYDHSGALIRMVAAADLTLAIAHGKTYLGGVCVWVAGTAAQQGDVAELILGGHAVSWALTEREHGSDLLAGDLIAEPTTVDGVAGYRLVGEKWLINNATRGTALCVLARTAVEGGTRGYSLFLVDKRHAQPGSVSPLPKELTHGIRGADISGIRLDGMFVPEDCRVGADGEGLEIVLQSMQITRTMCCYLSLGASDHALRIAGAFAAGRRLYGRGLLELPAARAVLAESVAAHLLAEVFSVTAARGLHGLPEQQSPLAAAAKFLVPTLVEESLVRLRRLTGARSLVAGAVPEGTMSKVERDHRIVSLFDGNTMVNLTTLVTQFPVLLRRSRELRPDEREGLVLMSDPSAPVGEADLGRLTLVARRGHALIRLLEDPSVADATVGLGEDAAAEVSDGVAVLRAELARLRDVTRSLPSHSVETPVEAFDAADSVAVCLAGAAALSVWIHGRASAGAGWDTDPSHGRLWREALWLRLALHAVRDRLGVGGGPMSEELVAGALASLSDGKTPTILRGTAAPTATAGADR